MGRYDVLITPAAPVEPYPVEKRYRRRDRRREARHLPRLAGAWLRDDGDRLPGDLHPLRTFRVRSAGRAAARRQALCRGRPSPLGGVVRSRARRLARGSRSIRRSGVSDAIGPRAGSSRSLLLFAAGTCIGLIFPLGKLAGEAGIPPLLLPASTLPGRASCSACISARDRRTDRALDRRTCAMPSIAGPADLRHSLRHARRRHSPPRLGHSGDPAVAHADPDARDRPRARHGAPERACASSGSRSGLAGAVIILSAAMPARSTSTRFDRLVPGRVPDPAGARCRQRLPDARLAAGRAWSLPLATLTLAAAAAALFALIGLSGGGRLPASTSSQPFATGWPLILAQSVATGDRLRVLLPAAAGRRPGLSQPDQLREYGRRRRLRGALLRRAADAVDVARRRARLRRRGARQPHAGRSASRQRVRRGRLTPGEPGRYRHLGHRIHRADIIWSPGGV